MKKTKSSKKIVLKITMSMTVMSLVFKFCPYPPDLLSYVYITLNLSIVLLAFARFSLPLLYFLSIISWPRGRRVLPQCKASQSLLPHSHPQQAMLAPLILAPMLHCLNLGFR